MFREEAGFHAGHLSWSNLNLEMLVLWREENRRTCRNTLVAKQETATNLTHIWHWAGIKPRPHSWRQALSLLQQC